MKKINASTDSSDQGESFYFEMKLLNLTANLFMLI